MAVPHIDDWLGSASAVASIGIRTICAVSPFRDLRRIVLETDGAAVRIPVERSEQLRIITHNIDVEQP